MSDVDVDCYFVHPTVPTRTAELLGVPSLTNRMLGADELFIGEEFGQEEKLTTRIERLLDDYTDNPTDVPMFVSCNYFAIFDPHTKYLGKAIRNARRPGKKINLNKDVKRLRRFKNQFKPFNGVFGCNLSLENDNPSFDGMLFRLPLRTREQANTSDIKRLYYDNQQMRELLVMIVHGPGNLLLFTQNVLRLGIYHVLKLAGQDLKPSLMFEVIRSTAQEGGILRELTFQDFTAPQTALKLSLQ